MHEEQDVIWHGRGLTRTAHGRSLSCWGERMGLRYNLNLRIFSSSSSCSMETSWKHIHSCGRSERRRYSSAGI